MRVLFASRNAGKQQEAAAILETSQVTLAYPNQFPELGKDEPEETGETFAENAQLKARWYADKTQTIAIADDTGLEINALGGLPGVHSKRMAPGSDTDRNQLLLEKLGDNPDRSAQAVTAMAIWDPFQKAGAVFEGVLSGTISQTLRGQRGFGFDPIFIPEGFDRTQSELSAAEKNKISSRKKALKQVRSYLEQQYELKEE